MKRMATNSDGEDVAPTICAGISKCVRNQLAYGGGFMLGERKKTRKCFNLELYDKGSSEVCGCKYARYANDWPIYE